MTQTTDLSELVGNLEFLPLLNGSALICTKNLVYYRYQTIPLHVLKWSLTLDKSAGLSSLLCNCVSLVHLQLSTFLHPSTRGPVKGRQCYW